MEVTGAVLPKLFTQLVRWLRIFVLVRSCIIRLTPTWNISSLLISAQKRSILRVNVETHRYFGWQQARLGFRAPDRSSQDSIRGTIALVGKGGNFEHTWVSYTTCPDGRDEWGWLITETNRQLQEDEEDEDMPKFIQLKGSRAIAIVDGNTKLQVRQELLSALYGPITTLPVSQDDWDSIPNAPDWDKILAALGSGGGDGPTLEEMVEAFEQANRKAWR